jgi:hypothetical protein
MVLDDLQKAVADLYHGRARIERRTDDGFDLHIEHQFLALFRFEDTSSSEAISVQILDLSVGFRDAMRRIREHLCPLFEAVERTLVIRQDGRKYGMTAYFNGENPYYGIFIRKLDLSAVENFALVIKTTGTDKSISVTRNGVSLVAKSINSFRSNVECAFCLTMGMT